MSAPKCCNPRSSGGGALTNPRTCRQRPSTSPPATTPAGASAARRRTSTPLAPASASGAAASPGATRATQSPYERRPMSASSPRAIAPTADGWTPRTQRCRRTTSRPLGPRTRCDRRGQPPSWIIERTTRAAAARSAARRCSGRRGGCDSPARPPTLAPCTAASVPGPLSHLALHAFGQWHCRRRRQSSRGRAHRRRCPRRRPTSSDARRQGQKPARGKRPPLAATKPRRSAEASGAAPGA
mmetsp:Transcript_120234/g.347480  ORF Transcript_120234/g.347480 Transcript_120234/m.347480 type:complete len:241 (-) Transcript_120234:23-745(-)